MRNMQNLLQEYQIAHIGFVVESREAAMARFSELYGITEWQLVEWKPSRIVYKGEAYTDAYVKIAISLPNEGTRLELLEPKTGGFHMDALKRGGQTINHICHVVEDFDAVLQKFIDSGFELVMESEYTDEIRGYRRCHYVYSDLLNSFVEIAELPYFKNGRGERK